MVCTKKVTVGKNMLSRASSREHSAFTLVEIMIVIAIIGILVAIAVPGFLRSRAQSQAKACQENQIKLSGAVQEWVLSQNTSDMPDYTDLIGPGKFLGRTPRCPTTGQPILMPLTIQGNSSCPTDEPGHTISP